MKKETSFGFRRNLSFIGTNTILLFKSLKEYKIDLYFSLWSNFIYFITYYFFYIVLFDFLKILDWNNFDFALFFIAMWIGSLNTLNFSFRNFKQTLISGGLNINLTRPTNVFVTTSFDTTSGRNLFTVILNSILFFICALFFGYSLKSTLISYFILTVGTFSFILITDAVMLLSFYIKEIQSFYTKFVKDVIYLNEKFTPLMFEGNNILRNIFFILPSAFYGFFTIEVLKGRFDLMLQYLPNFLILNFFLIIFIYFIWNKGLKSYEAFG